MNMKTNKILVSAIFIFTSHFSTNAQLQIQNNGRLVVKNQTVILSDTNNISDGMDIRYSNPSISNGLDLIWGYFDKSQPYNPGLLTLMSYDGGYFTVRNNGRVGVFNNNPSCAMEIGTTGTNYELKVNGSIVLTSDERLKKNIKDIESSTEKLKLLKGVSYNFMGVDESLAGKENELQNKTGLDEKPVFKPKNNKASLERNYFGFLAQDVEKLYPELVYKDSAGVLGIDYIGIIPLLLNALNEQSEKISELESRLSTIETTAYQSTPQKIGASTSENSTDLLTYPVLEQNNPNPFNIATTISFYTPASTVSSSLYVYDMNGIQLKSYLITEKGKSSIVIRGSEFPAGMYLYALITDGKVIDTKRMILTK